MPCQNKCTKWKAKRPPNGKRYESGQIRCDTCQVFMYPSLEHTHNNRTKEPDDNPEHGLSCNCCNIRISGRSYSARYGRYQNPSSSKTFEELEKYFEEWIQPHANYQFVIVKTLLENNSNCNIDKIKEEIKFYNKTQENIDYDVGLSTLINHGFVSIEGDIAELNIDDYPIDTKRILQLISHCNRYIYQNIDPKSIQHFTAVGGYENWQHTISNLPFQWAITTTNQSNVAVWELANENDLVYYYPTQDNSPYNKRGFFGIGVIKKKLIDDALYWPDEISENKSKYPNKIILDTLHIVFDENELIEVPSATGLPFVKGFNRIADQKNKDTLFSRTNQQWNVFPQTSSEPNYYKIAPGAQAGNWYTQLKKGITAIGWKKLGELSNITLEELDKRMNEEKLGSINQNQIKDFLKIKKGDIIIANNGLSAIVGIGRVTGNYIYDPTSKYPHTYPVDWFDTKKRKIPEQSDWMKTVVPLNYSLYEELSTDDNLAENQHYLLLRHSAKKENKWKDDIGKKYHFGKIPNYTKLIRDTKTIWYDREEGDFYYWGYGDIRKVKQGLENDFEALFDNFTYFNDPKKENPETEDVIPKKGLDSTKEKIMNLPGWNNQISMLEITKEIYDEIVNGRIMSQFSEITPTKSVSDGKLRIPTKNEVKKGIKEIQKELLIEDSIIEEVVTHLASGRHVLLSGPVGTGKTRLSQLIPEMFWEENNGYFADVRTATADWNTQDVIGGISPKIQDGSRMPTYEVENGCVTDTILANYEKNSRYSEKPQRHTSIHTVNNKKQEFNGTWLVIDEFNRADIDKAFGQLFTALEYNKLIIQNIESGKSTRTIPIPEDYRIIGTLNTADKHYLFSLSDALKRRFAYVEVSIPSRTDKNKEREIYLATKNGLKDLDSEKFTDIIKVHENPDSIEYISDKVKNNLEYSYNILELVREFKPLGTAILKSIYQTLLVSEKMENDHSFDNAINANLIPQLETLPKSSLEILYFYIFGNLVEFLGKEDHKEQYRTGLESVLRYLNYSKEQIQTHLDGFTSGRLPENLRSSIETMKNARATSFPEKSLFKKSLEEIIKQSEF